MTSRRPTTVTRAFAALVLCSTLAAAGQTAKKEAYLDIGSGNIKLILIESAEDGKRPKIEILRSPILFQKNLTEDGKFPAAIEAQGLEILSGFADKARIVGAVMREGGATSVFRKADPSYACRLLSNWSAQTGWTIKIISPSEEAQAAYHAVSLLYPELKDVIVLDMGGGSAQLMTNEDGKFTFDTSPWGAVNVKNYLTPDIRRQGLASAVESLSEKMTQSPEIRRWASPQGKTCAVLGGVAYGLNKVIAPKDGVLTEDALNRFAGEIGSLSPADIECRYPSTAPYGDEMWSNAVAFLAWMRILNIREWKILELEMGVGMGVLGGRH
jgi:exopolyphosphatase/pppGpp-phosphohydrolase